MPQAKSTPATVRCACGSVELEARGAPIARVVCYCDDCQEGSRRITALPNAGAVLDADGGSDYVVYREDRIAYAKGAPLVSKQKLKQQSATNRVVADCCNSLLMLEFDDSKHWVSIYRRWVVGEVPAVQMRVCAKFKPAGVTLPGDAPISARYSFQFFRKLIAARLAMLLGR